MVVAAAQTPPGGAARLTAASCLAVAILTVMDPTTMTVASPVIATDLGTTVAQTSWIVNAFLLALSVLLVASGTASSRYGVLPMLKLGVAIFVVGALCSAVAPSGGLLILARALQGVGAAAIVPATMGLYRSTFPPARQPYAMGIYSGVCTGAAAFGPVVAGLVLEVAPWRVVFAVMGITAAIAGLTLAAATRHVARTPRHEAEGLGGRINISLAIGLTAVAWALISSGERGWTDATVLVALAVGAAVIAVVLGGLVRRRAASAARGFRPGQIAPYLTLVVVTNIPNLGVVFLLSAFLQRAQAMSAIATAVAILPCLATTSVLMPLSGRLYGHIAPALQIAAGLAMQLVGLLVLTRLTEHSGYWSIGPAIVLLGAGIALVVPTLLNGILGSADPSHSSLMGGSNLSANQFGGILGIAVLGSIVAASVGSHFIAAPGTGLSVAERGARVELLAAQGPRAVADREPIADRPAVLAAGEHASVRSTVAAMRFAAAMAAASLLFTIAMATTMRTARLRPSSAAPA